MRRTLITIAPLSLGLGILAIGFVYDVLYAGIPYPDPTPTQRADYNFHAGIAAKMMGAGGILVLLGFLWLLGCLIHFALHRRPKTPHP